MKKIFLSVPMKNRTKENIEATIRKMKSVISAMYEGEEIEFVNTIVEEKPPYELDKNHNAIWYLGKSLEILSQCDVFFTLNNAWKFSGCDIETHAAEAYDIEIHQLEGRFFAPDIIASDKSEFRLID